MKLPFKTPHTYSQYVRDDEVNNEPSLTIPDQTMTIPEILERFARGLPIGGQTEGYYDEDDDLPDYRTLDLEERAQLAIKYQTEILRLQNVKNEESTIVDNSVENSQSEENLNEES